MPQLLDAYLGLFASGYMIQYNEWVQARHDIYDHVALDSFEVWVAPRLRERIELDDPKIRLHNYLRWNGINGYTSTLYAIATGELV